MAKVMGRPETAQADTARAAEKERTAVQRIAAHVAGLRYDDLSELSVERGRQVVLDTLGTALGGYQTRLGRLAADYAHGMEGGDDATLWADGRRAGLLGAAWANGVMGKHLGMDDSHRTCGHVAAELVPLALAVAEQRKLDGRRVLTALAAGYDVFGCIHPFVSGWQRERGLDHKSQAGTIASAATAGLLLELDADQLAHAMALAMDMASGTEQYVYDSGFCDTKDLLAGYAARNGIYAAQLAKFGFQGPPRALDGAYGYFHAFGPGYDPAFIDWLGTRQTLAATGFKPHAGCRHVHACVDATQELLKQGRPPLEEIAAIEVRSYKEAVTPDFRVNYEPANSGAAGFSLPVTVAVMLVRGTWFREDILAYDEPEIRRLRHLVTVTLDEELEAAFPRKKGCVVTVTTRDGRVHEGRVDFAKGEPENMLTDAEFEAKFRYLVGDLLPQDRVAAILETAGRLETLDDVGSLVRLTVPPRRG